MDSILVILFTFCLFGQCIGHGAMYFPNPWWSQSECSENMSPADCEFHCYKEEEFASNCEPKGNMGCNRGCNLGVMAFFTNYTFVGERTIEKEYIAPHVPYKLSGSAWRWNLNPWNSPGSAKTFGEGCGVGGGNPWGCIGNPHDEEGRCCGGSWIWEKGVKTNKWRQGCGGYSRGRSAIEEYKRGAFQSHWAGPWAGRLGGTTWERGTAATVIWTMNAFHRGGYAYRLCGPVEKGKEWMVNEQCFRDGHLKFVGDKKWWFKVSSGKDAGNPDNWETHEAVKTNVGTNPEGSEWMMVTLPQTNGSGESVEWAIKDLVEVPESLEPGRYVLSFRWDCQQSPQVWNSCANIDII